MTRFPRRKTSLPGEIPSQIEVFSDCCTDVDKLFFAAGGQNRCHPRLLAEGASNFATGRFQSPSPSNKTKSLCCSRNNSVKPF